MGLNSGLSSTGHAIQCFSGSFLSFFMKISNRIDFHIQPIAEAAGSALKDFKYSIFQNAPAATQSTFFLIFAGAHFQSSFLLSENCVILHTMFATGDVNLVAKPHQTHIRTSCKLGISGGLGPSTTATCIWRCGVASSSC